MALLQSASSTSCDAGENAVNQQAEIWQLLSPREELPGFSRAGLIEHVRPEAGLLEVACPW
jgi:hypothetical protein